MAKEMISRISILVSIMCLLESAILYVCKDASYMTWVIITVTSFALGIVLKNRTDRRENI